MPLGDCKNKRRVIASYTTNASDPNLTTWDLTPYQSAGIGTPGGTWRLIEVGANLEYAHGKIAADGTLVSSDYVEPIGGGGNGGNGNNGSSGGAAGENGNSGNSSGGNVQTPSGLPNDFVSQYSYPGYMELQEEEPQEECPDPECKHEECCKCQC